MKVIYKGSEIINSFLDAQYLMNFKIFEKNLIKGKEYIVMGLMNYKDFNTIYYLVDDYYFPYWVPHIFFDIMDNCISPNWHIKIFNNNNFSNALFYLSGFRELCQINECYQALLLHEEWALGIYFKRRHEVQEWYFEKSIKF